MPKIEGQRYEYEMNMLLSYKEYEFKFNETVYINDNEASHCNQDGLMIYKYLYLPYHLSNFVVNYVVPP